MSRASRRRAVANANSPRLSVCCSRPASKADSRSLVLPMPTTAVTASSALLVALAAVAATFWLPTTTAALVPFGYQTAHSANAFGPSSLGGGSTYAASAVYDPVASTLYMVGASYESSATRMSPSPSSDSSPAASAATDCYLTALVLPSDDPSPMSGGGILTQTLGETEISESCTAVALLSSTFEGTYADPDEQERTDSDERNDDRNEETAHLLLLGHTAPDGLLTELRPMGSDKSSIYGYAMDVAVTASMPAFFSSGGIEQPQQQQYSGGVNFSADLLGGRLFHEDVVVYPIAATTDNAVGSQRNDDAEEGDDVRNSAGPEFVYVLFHKLFIGFLPSFRIKFPKHSSCF